jgi:hypothetical protein
MSAVERRGRNDYVGATHEWNYLLDVTDPAGSARFIQNCTQSSADSGFIAVTAVQGIDYCAGFEHI